MKLWFLQHGSGLGAGEKVAVTAVGQEEVMKTEVSGWIDTMFQKK